MSKEDGYKIRNQHEIHFITFAVVNWIDVFSRRIYKDIVVESLTYCQKNKGLKIHAWCIMSNHIHLLISSDENKLSDLLRDFKKFTSKQIIKTIKENSKESRKEWMIKLFREAGLKNKRNKNYQFWRQDNHPVEVFSNKFIDQKLNYLHNNPVKAGIVEFDADYIYSSAKDYSGEAGLIEIDMIR